MTKLHHDHSEMNALFIHSAIDDAGLSVHEFRLVCHLARRSGKGDAFPSAETMAKVCRMKRDTVFSALKVLAERNIVTLKRRKGQSSLYIINKPSQWKEPVPRNGAAPNGGASPETGLHPSPETGLPPAPNGGTLRIYPEGNTHKVIPTPIPPKGASVKSLAEEIFQAYPRKVGKEKAIRSITKWLKEGKDPKWLLGRVRAYANAREGQEPRFTPYPATWFNRGSFDDDESEWGADQSKLLTADDV